MTKASLHATASTDARAEAAAEAALRAIVLATAAGEQDVMACGIVYAVVVLGGVARVFVDDEKFELEQIMAGELPRLVEESLLAVDGIHRVVVKPKPRSICRASATPCIRHVVAVHSVKGGVGKSTLTVYLARALARLGWRVGILDADVYGPSVPLLLGLEGRAQTTAGGDKLQPAEAEGVKVVSLGLLLPDDAPLIWRGNLVDEGMPQMFAQVAWGELDMLLIDMPPGTGDVPIAVAQHVPLAGVIGVSAPSVLSLIDVARGLEFFADIRVPVLGLVENMASFHCDCGEVIPLFGRGGVARLCKALGIELLASLPFIPGVVAASEKHALYDAGEGSWRASFDALAYRLAQHLNGSEQSRG